MKTIRKALLIAVIVVCGVAVFDGPCIPGIPCHVTK
jgi:hypothetical protein